MDDQKDIIRRIHCSYNNAPPDKQRNENDRKDKRVRFPEDNVISQYLEPFKPVPDNCTSEELTNAYLKSCIHYKVEPIGFLLEQLKGIDLSICNDRYSQLSLRGVRLNRLQIETLEEIFRRVHFRELDFEDTFLDEQSAIALFDMLLHYETCYQLSISLSLDKSSQAWVRCVSFLRRSGALRRFILTKTQLLAEHFILNNFFGLCLERLSLRYCSLSGKALLELVRLMKMLLSSPSLNHPRCSAGRQNGVRKQRSVNGTAQTSLGAPVWRLHLDLTGNRLIPEDATALLALVRHQILRPKSDLVESHLTESAATSSAESPPEKQGLLPAGGIGYLSYLNLSNNNLGDAGVRILCEGLLQSFRTRLHKLSTGITDPQPASGSSCKSNYVPFAGVQPDVAVQGASNSCQEVSSTTPSSSETGNVSPAGTGQVALCVQALEGISLASNNLTTESMQFLSTVLMHTPVQLARSLPGLVTLDLSWNASIGGSGVATLCQGLTRNHSLKELYLRSVGLSFQGTFAIASMLSENKCLELLDIRHNPLNLTSVMALSKTMAFNKSLTSLLSDARNLVSGDSPLIATHAELVIFLLDDIEAYLQQNRSLAKDNPSLTSTNGTSRTTAGVASDSTTTGELTGCNGTVVGDVRAPNGAPMTVMGSGEEGSKLTSGEVSPQAAAAAAAAELRDASTETGLQLEPDRPPRTSDSAPLP